MSGLRDGVGVAVVWIFVQLVECRPRFPFPYGVRWAFYTVLRTAHIPYDSLEISLHFLSSPLLSFDGKACHLIPCHTMPCRIALGLLGEKGGGEATKRGIKEWREDGRWTKPAERGGF